jgi:hypothetical protein
MEAAVAPPRFPAAAELRSVPTQCIACRQALRLLGARKRECVLLRPAAESQRSSSPLSISTTALGTLRTPAIACPRRQSSSGADVLEPHGSARSGGQSRVRPYSTISFARPVPWPAKQECATEPCWPPWPPSGHIIWESASNGPLPSGARPGWMARLAAYPDGLSPRFFCLQWQPRAQRRGRASRLGAT